MSIGIVPSLSSVTRFDLKVPVKFANPYSGFLELQTKDIPLEGAIQSNCTLLGDNDYLRYRVQPHTDPSVSIWIQENMALKIQENSKPGKSLTSHQCVFMTPLSSFHPDSKEQRESCPTHFGEDFL